MKEANQMEKTVLEAAIETADRFQEVLTSEVKIPGTAPCQIVCRSGSTSDAKRETNGDITFRQRVSIVISTTAELQVTLSEKGVVSYRKM